MYNKTVNKIDNTARILMFSQRNIVEKYLYRLFLYEFEDIILQIDSVEILEPHPKKYYKYRNTVAKKMTKYSSITINPGLPKIKVKNYYDIFFATVTFLKDLLYIKNVQGWEDHCKTSICWVDEIWLDQIMRFKWGLKILSKFDYVILSCSQSVNAINELIPGKCFYLPPGIDSILFCPYPKPPKRFIDVYSMGRRSEVVHQTLLRMAEEKKIVYIYDTTVGGKVINAKQHRFLLANIAKRSRYFIVNTGKIDLNSERGRQSEIGPRFFEGAASGTIMIGDFPKTEEFKKSFNWSDVVIYLPFDSDNIDKVINELDKNPRRQEQIRRNNVVQSLLKHDWVYRWESVLKTAGIEPLPELIERKKRLKDLSKFIEKI